MNDLLSTSVINEIIINPAREPSLKETSQSITLCDVFSHALFKAPIFNSALNYEIDRSLRFKDPFSVIHIDLDNFYYINEVYGHSVGDRLISLFGERLFKVFRKVDVITRTGGNAFKIILPKTDVRDGMLVGHKVHNAINQEFFSVNSKQISIKASISVVSFPLHGKNSTEIIQAGEDLMKLAKNSGKNTVVLAPHKLENQANSSAKAHIACIRRAITENRIELVLEPIVNIDDANIFAYEALARVLENGVLVKANHFIEEAEALGMVKEIDEAIFRKGLVKLQSLPPLVKIFFNFSTSSFNDVTWMKKLVTITHENGVQCNRIVIEITERELLPNIAQTQSIIHDLRMHGFEFALDDFGTGFSSLLYLQQLPVNYLKIDGEFIRNLRCNKYDMLIVANIINLAKSFNLKTIAEFVENHETVTLLNQAGIDFAQGFHFREIG